MLQKNYKYLLVHIAIWIFWFGVPILFSWLQTRERSIFISHMWLTMGLSVGLFYINYLILIEKYLFGKKISAFLLINFFLIVACILISEIFKPVFIPVESRQMIAPDREMLPPRPPLFRIRMITAMPISYVLTISVAIAIRTTSRWFKTESERRSLENENLRSELNNLKMQLNPHFFFNTLNNIYSLIQIAPSKAQQIVHGLGKLMRYHLYETNSEKVPLKGELEFLENYVSIMQLRTNPNVKIHMNFAITNPDEKIAPLLFVPIVENAFKFGVSSDIPSEITIHLKEENKLVELMVSNTIASKSLELDPHKGIGISNLKKRLELIYKDNYSFKAVEKNGKYIVNMNIQLRKN